MAWFVLPQLVRHMTYPVPEEEVPSPPPPPITEVFLENQAGEQLSSWFLPCPKEEAPVVIFFHGNGQHLGTMLYNGFLHRFKAYDVHLLALDYPGYGTSGGEPSEAAIMESATLAVDWALENYPDAPKILMGWSLGSAVAVEMSAQFVGHHDGLILLSPWTSIRDVAAHHYPNWMVRLLMKENYDSKKAAQSVTVPSLVVHGESDDLIPFEQGKALAATLGLQGRCQLVGVRGYGHNDLMNAALTWTHIQHFLAQFQVRER